MRFAPSRLLVHLTATASLGVWLAALCLPGGSARAQALDAGVLARVDFSGSPAAYPLPVQALLQDADGRDYLLVFAAEAALKQAGHPWRVIEAWAGAPEGYLLALPQRAGARAAVWARFRPLADDGRQLLLRADEAEVAELAGLGCALQRLDSTPLRWTLPRQPQTKDGDPWSPRFSSPPHDQVAALLDRVASTNLYWLMRRLTGEEALLSAGEAYVVSNRNTSGAALRRAVQFATNRFVALGLETQLHPFRVGSVTNHNVIATQPGGALANEVVLLTAHLDNMPQGPRAPGADDNASGSAAVLVTAGLLQQFQFERTVRYVLFTGEEQGLYGSGAYAGLMATNAENIVGVLNLDMIAWDRVGAPAMHLYTRTVTHPGFSNDLAIVSLFTNCVASYGLGGQLVPRIIASAMGYSDHAPFWNRGFPATCVIEEYGGDFHAYYHTVNDTVAQVNWNYFTAMTRASLATFAHMARPAGFTRRGMMEVAASDWRSASGTGAGAFRAQWGDDAELGLDAMDVPWAEIAPSGHARELRAGSQLGAVALQSEARPDDGDVRFRVELTAGATNAVVFASTNRLRFEPLTDLEPDRTYTVRLALDPAFAGTAGSEPGFADLRAALDQGGFLEVPPLVGLTNGAVYGVCDLAVRALATNRTDCPLQLLAGAEVLTLVTRAQVGTRIVDELETATDFASAWQPVAAFTNHVVPDAASFDSGWRELTYRLGQPVVPGESQRYFRLRRVWLSPRW
jgi:hypothetical protein